MKSKFIPVMMMAILSLFGCSRQNDEHPVLMELAELPIGITIAHTPVEVDGPVRGLDTGWAHSWQFKTEVRALNRRLTVEKFGIIAWDGTRWVLPETPSQWNCGVLDRKTFADWYGANGGVLEPGITAVDPQNWAGSRERKDFQQKWFVIAVDQDGKKWKGEGVVYLKVRN